MTTLTLPCEDCKLRGWSQLILLWLLAVVAFSASGLLANGEGLKLAINRALGRHARVGQPQLLAGVQEGRTAHRERQHGGGARARVVREGLVLLAIARVQAETIAQCRIEMAEGTLPEAETEEPGLATEASSCKAATCAEKARRP